MRGRTLSHARHGSWRPCPQALPASILYRTAGAGILRSESRMPDSRRLGTAQNAQTATLDSRTEALLVDGLERYFNADYEEAIHLWTRVLFLDRSHARARAYIDRARTALTERQRVAEQLLHESREWLARGQTAEARSLLTEAIATSGDDERAAALRMELERVERA